MKVLVTGGAGYIGSHTVIELYDQGYEPYIVDNFSNSSPEVIDRLEQITGKKIPYKELDLMEYPSLENLLTKNSFDAVIHFAAKKSPFESTENPLKYYHHNLLTTLHVCMAMQAANIHKLVFSSSAAVYGAAKQTPVKEDSPLSPINPYGHTKAISEQILKDLTATDYPWQISILRYFNPIGAHPSGLIGENLSDIPNNLMPYIQKVSRGDLPKLTVYGNDYNTPDGTGIRDYIHVVDLARGHIAALKHLPKRGHVITNLGTGKGTSVLELIQAFEQASGLTIPHKIGPRRPGDMAISYASIDKAKQLLDWQSQYSILDACNDSWRWQNKLNR